MATKNKKDKNALIQCEHCGEYYSVTYRRCPFCDEYDDEESRREGGARGGKRLVTNTRGGGYGRGWTPGRIILTLLSLAMIVAAIYIVFTIIKPLVDLGKTSTGDPTPTPGVTGTVDPTPDVVEPSPGLIEPSPSQPVDELPPEQQIPSTQTANGFTLNKSDFTLSYAGESYQIKPTFTPAGSEGFLTWSSSDPTVATVSENGTVTGVGRGTCTVTATMAGGVSQKCIVRCTFSAASTTTTEPTPTPDTSSGGDFELSRADFTLSRVGETYRITTSGGSGNVTWYSSDTDVATVSGDGTVTAVSEGTCTVTASSGGVSRSCIVRVNF